DNQQSRSTKRQSSHISHRVIAEEGKAEEQRRRKEGPAEETESVSLASTQATTGAPGWLEHEPTSGHQGPGWPCAARLQADQAEANGTLPAAG
ncbi:hypothetical protein HaLaN_21526, partial [Haematococcus lacustris]